MVKLYMPDFRKILLEAAKPAVSEIVSIQRDFLDGKGDIKYKKTELDGSPAAPATVLPPYNWSTE